MFALVDTFKQVPAEANIEFKFPQKEREFNQYK